MFQLGIDVSKKTLDLCLLREGVKGRVTTRKLQNDINAVNAVIAWLSKQHCKPEDGVLRREPQIFPLSQF